MKKDVKASALISWCAGHLGDGYVYGAVGQACTVSLLQSLEKMWGPNGTWPSVAAGYYHQSGDYAKGRASRWLGRWASDCSGLIKRGRKELGGNWADVSAQGTFDQCSARGAIADMPNQPGTLVFMWSSAKNRMGHVGIFIGNGEVIEARGVDYGVVKTRLSSRAWQYWGQTDWMEMDMGMADIAASSVPPSSSTTDSGDASNAKAGDAFIRNGDRGDHVAALQRTLTEKGYALGAIDGIFGAKTLAAVKLFQKDHGLAEDGIVGPKTRQALEDSTPGRPAAATPALERLLRMASPYMRGEDVRLLQRRLTDKGYACGAVDGIFGPKTLAAIQQYQKVNALVCDGIAGPKTWACLWQ